MSVLSCGKEKAEVGFISSLHIIIMLIAVVIVDAATAKL